MIMMKLQPIWFDKIKSGKKTLELGLNDEKRQQVNVGDLVIFKKEPDCYDGVVAKVVDKKFFKTFLGLHFLSCEATPERHPLGDSFAILPPIPTIVNTFFQFF